MRITPIVWIKDRANIAHHQQIFRTKNERHLLAFLNTDAVLSSQATTQVYTRFQNFLAGLDHPLSFARVALVIHQNRMNITVARVKNVGNT